MIAPAAAITASASSTSASALALCQKNSERATPSRTPRSPEGPRVPTFSSLPARRARVAGSAGSGPEITANSSAASATDLAIGPTVSWVAETGTTPVRLTLPTVGLIPTSPETADGDRIEPSVSVPSAKGARPAATAAPEPELDPLGLRSST